MSAPAPAVQASPVHVEPIRHEVQEEDASITSEDQDEEDQSITDQEESSSSEQSLTEN